MMPYTIISLYVSLLLLENKNQFIKRFEKKKDKITNKSIVLFLKRMTMELALLSPYYLSIFLILDNKLESFGITFFG
jgi:hypothetical protein